jgi:hypothetical protein
MDTILCWIYGHFREMRSKVLLRISNRIKHQDITHSYLRRHDIIISFHDNALLTAATLWQHIKGIYKENICTVRSYSPLQYHFVFNPLTPELNPSAQRCLTRFFTGDFSS